ncbi:MAG: hypothetical protein IE931_07995 [Sphingobacteriales bacterium]|nr:hypothetical protein [Sphingobacteriales bacterium]
MTRILTFIFALFISTQAFAQTVNPRPITLDEYEKAKTFSISDLDNDTYVKFENTYLLDRYEGKKPFFITGDDGYKKRIDLYKLIAKDGLQELGLMVFYTNETGKIYKTIVPNFTAEGKVWEKYFEDIHAIDKVEPNFVLKLSYVLSRELSYQQYKNINGGKEIKDEHATYGNDICFPGEQLVMLHNGSQKMLKDIKSGDEIISVNPETKKIEVAKVKELTSHQAKDYALTQLTLVKDEIKGNEVFLYAKVIKATPNHPMKTNVGDQKIGEIQVGETVLCLNNETGKIDAFKVIIHQNLTEGSQKVYNIVADAGSTLMLNGVMVKQK